MLRTLLCLLGLAFTQLHAQPVFNRADMPVAGDTARVMNASAPTSVTARLNVAGAQKRWDFSDLQPTQSELVHFRGATETPYFFFILANAFGTKVADSINLILLSLQNVYDFYNTTNARYAAVGRGVTVQGFPLPAQYTDADEVYFFPLQFGRRDTSTFAYGLNIPGTGGYNSRGGRLTEVDAWGELVTPFGTYQTLRVKSTLRIIDSISFNGFNLALPVRTEVEYKWLAKGEKVPVLQIRGNSLFGLFTPTTVQYRYDLPRIVPPVTVPINPGEVVLYPNPAHDLIYIGINSLDRIDHIQVFDEFGKLLYDQAGNRSLFDVRELNAGVYHMRLQGQYGTYSKKFVVASR